MDEKQALVLRKEKVEREIVATKKQLSRLALKERWLERLSVAPAFFFSSFGFFAFLVIIHTLGVRTSVAILLGAVVWLVVALWRRVPETDPKWPLQSRLTELQERREVHERNITVASRPNPYRD